MSSAMISYGGVFTSHYRQELQNQWKDYIMNLEIKLEEDTNLVNFLGKPVSIQQWTMVGLPKD